MSQAVEIWKLKATHKAMEEEMSKTDEGRAKAITSKAIEDF